MIKEYNYTQEIFIPRPLNKVFEFFSKAENLEKLTPPRLKFNILTPAPIKMKQGLFIDYQIRLLGLPFKWKTEITVWKPPYRFQDVQLKGPYRKWQHTHSFREVEGGTQMTDEVLYQIPFSLISPLMNALFIKKQLTPIFSYRKEQMDTIFGLNNV